MIPIGESKESRGCTNDTYILGKGLKINGKFGMCSDAVTSSSPFRGKLLLSSPFNFARDRTRKTPNQNVGFIRDRYILK
tara:strand:+ start:331 stop:567 length:237 start_codon:yes stop_codon:yes gene_type:complete